MRAVDEIAHVTSHLLEDLETAAPPRDREVEAASGARPRREALRRRRVAAARAAAARRSCPRGSGGTARVDRPAGDPRGHLPGVNLAPVPVEVLAQPLVDRAERSLLDLLVRVGQVGHEALPDLHREDVPQLVGREIPEHAA